MLENNILDTNNNNDIQNTSRLEQDEVDKFINPRANTSIYQKEMESLLSTNSLKIKRRGN